MDLLAGGFEWTDQQVGAKGEGFCAANLTACERAWGQIGDGRGKAIEGQSLPQWVRRGAQVPDMDAVAAALGKDATARRVMGKKLAPAVGDCVGVRLNLNILRSQGVCVHSIHQGGAADKPMRGRGFWDGQVLDYQAVVTLRNAWFSVHQAGRQAIASGKQAKHPMASIDGELCQADASTDGVEARFNPKVTHLFIDEQGMALRWAQEVTIIGHRAYARGILVYHNHETAPQQSKGDAASVARLWQ